MMLEPGVQIGSYRVEEMIGRGGMGVVYRATDTRLNRPVAIKFLSETLLDANAGRRFQREAQMASALNHPHILTVHDVGDYQGAQYLVTEFIDGGTLKEWLTAEPRSWRQCVELMIGVADALGATHAANILHRDIKPGNILVSRSGHPKLVDFGLAKPALTPDSSGAESGALTRAGAMVGTAAYMSPEQIAGRALDVRCDIFSFGAVLYEMLAGHRPFGGATDLDVMVAVTKAAPAPLPEQIPEALRTIVEKAIEKDPAERYQSMRDLVVDLKRVARKAGAPASTLAGASVPPTGATVSGAATSAERVAPPVRRRSVVPIAVAVAALVVVAIGAGYLVFNRTAQARWAREEAIPEIEAFIDRGDYEASYALAMEVARRAPDNDQLAALWSRFSSSGSIASEPPGARVFRRGYDSTEEDWVAIGVTPIASVRVPHGLSRLRFELEGRAPLERTLMGALPVQRGERSVEGTRDASDQSTDGNRRPFVLDTVETLPDGKVRVPGWKEEIDGQTVEFLDFFLGRHEVTNREYKAFLDAAGYQDPRYWKYPIMDLGVEIPWQEAVARFTDRTGRPGPSTWTSGDYPDGQDDYPVGGISWYEAAAFAAFRGEELPTIYHWLRAVDPSQQAWVLPASNFASTGPVAVGTKPGMTWPGAYDLGGNVREWLFNELAGQRFILGGGWNDHMWVGMTFGSTQPALDRSPTNGVRLALSRDPPAVIAKARLSPSQQPRRNLAEVAPPSDEVFGGFRSWYAYDSTPLNAVTEATVESRNWIREHIAFDAAYLGERMGVYLYVPRGASPPYQTVVFLPGADGWFTPTIDHLSVHLDFVVKTGRAVAVPIYQGMFERRRGRTAIGGGAPTTSARDFYVQIHKDFRRTLDYLETRRDIDVGAFALYGLSIGGRFAPSMLALEPRLKAAILALTGIGPRWTYLPEVDPMNYLSRITLPVLMLNSDLDNLVPLEEDAKPVFMKLGTPAESKRQVIEPGGHFVPQDVLIRETLDWLDKYLGPVKRGL